MAQAREREIQNGDRIRMTRAQCDSILLADKAEPFDVAWAKRNATEVVIVSDADTRGNAGEIVVEFHGPTLGGKRRHIAPEGVEVVQ